MEVAEASVFSDEDAAVLAHGEADPYGTDHLAITWAPKHRHVLLSEDGRLVGHAGYLDIEVDADGSHLSGVGLGGVMVHPSARGRGVGTHLVRETTDRMRVTGRSFGLLFCRDVRLPFYERLGWRRVAGEVVVDQRTGPLVMPLFTCWLSFDDGRPPTDGLRVVGPPF